MERKVTDSADFSEETGLNEITSIFTEK
jgi:hypothetical protein